MKVGELLKLLEGEDDNNDVLMVVNLKMSGRMIPCGFSNIHKVDQNELSYYRGKTILLTTLSENDEKLIESSL